ncbi:MAG: hypothetical protein V2J25_13935 [Desulfatiglans sp.]|jgi:acetyl-CoA decarbonylase/synthase complex subunit alpha|nr:hypothetical protein [Desulfatiglans sp.]
MEEKKKGEFTVGKEVYNWSRFVRDPRGMEDFLSESVAVDSADYRFKQFEARFFPNADTADLAEMDDVVLGRYSPLYTGLHETCDDCPQGPCDFQEGDGKCGLAMEAFQAKLNLKTACRGSLSQMMDSREVLNHAIKVYGRDKEVHQGGERCYMGDWANCIGLYTGIWANNLDRLDMAMTYAEAQLTKLFQAGFQGNGTVKEFEAMTFQVGYAQGIAQDVAELVKISCFDFIAAPGQPADIMNVWPPVTVLGGLGNVDTDKPVIAVMGDSFLPAWSAVQYLKEKELTEQIEVCGIGSAGHDVTRFYDRCRIVAPMMRAAKAIRSGVADVVIASNACVPFDVAGEAKRVETRVIWTGHQGTGGLPDRTDDPAEEIVADLVEGAQGAWIRDAEKAGTVAVEAAQKIKRKGDYLLSEEAVKKEAARCLDDCDLCFSVCPNNLPFSRAVRAAQQEGIIALAEVEKGCYLCGRCEEACPADIPLCDLIVAAQAKRAPEEKFPIRPGRGAIPVSELLQDTFAILYGNQPGAYLLHGCGDAPADELAWIAFRLADRNCLLTLAGCVAGEVASYFNEKTGKYLYEDFGAEFNARNIINCGGCSAISHFLDNTLKAAKCSSGITHYANWLETADFDFDRISTVAIIWGAKPERMQAVAAAHIRHGIPCIVGPTSGFEWNRYLMGNRYDRDAWWIYDGQDAHIRELEPSPRSMIIPVETKEEVVTIGINMMMKLQDIRDSRLSRHNLYLDFHDEFFGGLPDDWHLFVRSDMELPLKKKAKLLKELRDTHGWETKGLRIVKARDRDGNLRPQKEIITYYGIEQGRYSTHLPRYLISQEIRDKTRQVQGDVK